MDINEIIAGLGIDLNDPEARSGAVDAIQAILDSRQTGSGGGGGGGSMPPPAEIQIDPELLQPSSKGNSEDGQDDFEYDDEEGLLDQVKSNGQDDAGNNAGANDESKTGSSSNTSNSNTDDTGQTKDGDEADDSGNEDGGVGIVDLEAKKQLESRQIKQERTAAAGSAALEAAETSGEVSQDKLDRLSAAIKDLEALTEEDMATMSEGAFNRAVNKVFDAMDAVDAKGVTYSTDDERKIKAAEIKRDLEDPLTQSEIYGDDLQGIRRDRAAQAARDAENARYARKSRDSFSGFDDFIKSLNRAIARQVAETETSVPSWSVPNRRRAGTNIISPGQKLRKLPNKRIPVIDFYFDCSRSWSMSDLDKGKLAIQALVDLEKENKIKVNTWYFANHVYPHPDPPRREGGTQAWNDIIQNIQSTKATNVVIMTDDDMQRQGGDSGFLTATVPGYVWYLWRDGDNAPRLPHDLRGRKGTAEFSFTSN